MNCHICGRTMKSDEIKFDDTWKGGISACGVCLEAISNVFGEGDVLTDDEVMDDVKREWGDFLSEDIEGAVEEGVEENT